MQYGDKLNAKKPLSWKKSFSICVVTPHKITNCNKCSKDVLCDDCDKLVHQNKKFSNLIELKRQAHNENSYMLPWYETIWKWYLYTQIT